jgi:hypothetical protein
VAGSIRLIFQEKVIGVWFWLKSFSTAPVGPYSCLAHKLLLSAQVVNDAPIFVFFSQPWKAPASQFPIPESRLLEHTSV